MTMTSINKVKFASINDKRYYGYEGIVSLPFGYYLLNEVRGYKKSLPKILRSICSQPIIYCKLNEKNTHKIKSVEQTTMRDYILNSKFL